MKKFEELEFRDDFMFCTVLRNNPELCRELLECVLGRKVGELVRVESQHPVWETPDRHGVRFDVYAADGSEVYDVEMQNVSSPDLPKRTRYSQSMLDLELLNRGMRYRDLRKSYVIYICGFNLIPKLGLHRYTFRSILVENREYELGDEAEKVFVCTQGRADDISPGLMSLLNYIEAKIPEDGLTERLDAAVKRTRFDPRERRAYMDLREIIEHEKDELREQLQDTEAQLQDAKVQLQDAETREKILLEEIKELKEKLGQKQAQ